MVKELKNWTFMNLPMAKKQSILFWLIFAAIPEDIFREKEKIKNKWSYLRPTPAHMKVTSITQRSSQLNPRNNMAASLNYMPETEPWEKNQPQKMGPLKLQKALRRSAPSFFRS